MKNQSGAKGNGYTVQMEDGDLKIAKNSAMESHHGRSNHVEKLSLNNVTASGANGSHLSRAGEYLFLSTDQKEDPGKLTVLDSETLDPIFSTKLSANFPNPGPAVVSDDQILVRDKKLGNIISYGPCQVAKDGCLDSLGDKLPRRHLETGRVILDNQRRDWVTVSFNRSFSEPVVMPSSLNTGAVEELEIRGVEEDKFEITTDSKTETDAGYVAFNSGEYLLQKINDSTIKQVRNHVRNSPLSFPGIEAINSKNLIRKLQRRIHEISRIEVSKSSVGNEWRHVELNYSYEPVVLTHIQDIKEGQGDARSLVRDVSKNGFDVKVVDGGGSAESNEVGYVGKNKGDSGFGDTEFEADDVEVSGGGRYVEFNNTFDTQPHLIAERVTLNNGEKVEVRQHNLTRQGVSLRLDVGDHVEEVEAETVNYLAYRKKKGDQK
ncbi:MAG: hypothetical protein ABEK59_06760 [Halobacteria archaeon]